MVQLTCAFTFTYRHICTNIHVGKWVNYNIYIYQYLRHDYSLLDVLLLSRTIILSVTVTELQKKWAQRNLSERYHFLGCTHSTICIFCHFFVKFPPPPSQLTYFLNSPMILVFIYLSNTRDSLCKIESMHDFKNTCKGLSSQKTLGVTL